MEKNHNTNNLSTQVKEIKYPKHTMFTIIQSTKGMLWNEVVTTSLATWKCKVNR